MNRITLELAAPYVGLRPFTEKEVLLFFGRNDHVRDLRDKLEGKQRFIAVLGASGTGKSSLVRAGLIPALHRGALAKAGHSWNVCIFKPGDSPVGNLASELAKDPRWLDTDDRATAVSALRAALAESPRALADLYRERSDVLEGQSLLLVVDQFEEIFRYRQKNAEEAEAFIQLLLRSATEDVPIYIAITMRSDFLGNCVAFFGLPEAINSGIYLTPRLGLDQLKSVIVSPLGFVAGDIDPVLVTKLVNSLQGEDELPILEHALLRMWNRARAEGRNRIGEEDFAAVCAPRDGPVRIGDAWRGPPSHPMLAFAIDNHASEIYDALTPHRQRIARQLFLALVERREGREVRRPQDLRELVRQVGETQRDHLIAVIEAFRAEGAGFLLPPASEPIRDDVLIDITHESLFRQWHLFQLWLSEEQQDVDDLREWMQRAARQKGGGGWLDESDCERALRWRVRVNERAQPTVWAARYGSSETYAQVDGYIESSLRRVNEVKAERERIEREANEAKLQRLEAEAALQKRAAEQAEVEKLQAEKEKRQAEAFARTTRRRSLIALTAAVLAIVFGLFAVGMWIQADAERKRAQASELVATAENLAKDYPDQSLLLALAARRISPIAKADALIRAARASYSYKTVFRNASSAQFSADGRMLVTASPDHSARLWDVASGKELHVLRGHEDEVSSAQFSADGKTVVTASEDKSARLWDVASGKALHVLRGHEGSVYSAQFSADGKTVVTASADKSARLWEVVSGRELHVLRGHEREVSSAQFSADGKTVVTVGGDQSARLWDVASGKELQVLRGHESGVYSAQFSADGKTVVTASADGTARIWPCVVCRPVDEIAVEMAKAVGRELTEEERRRFGVPEGLARKN